MEFEIETPKTGNFLRDADRSVAGYQITGLRAKCMLVPRGGTAAVERLRDAFLQEFVGAWTRTPFVASHAGTVYQLEDCGEPELRRWIAVSFGDLEDRSSLDLDLHLAGPAVKAVAGVSRFSHLSTLDFNPIWASAGVMFSAAQVEAIVQGYSGEATAEDEGEPGRPFILHDYVSSLRINHAGWPKRTVRKWLQQLPVSQEQEE